jgi:hypothetical protein
MTAALRAWNEDFRPFRVDDFARRIRVPAEGFRYEFNERQSPYAVLADFDGNGWRDAALYGVSGDSVHLVAVLDDSAAARVDRIESWPSGFQERGKLDTFLWYVGAGRLSVPWDDPDSTVTLSRPGIVLVYFEKAAITHYFSDGRWQSIVTGD